MIKTVEMTGHIVDSLLLSKVLDCILGNGGNYEIKELKLGYSREDISVVKIEIKADDIDKMNLIIDTIKLHGAIEL